MGIFIGIDCGTQSLKTLAWNSTNGEVLSVSKPYGLVPGLPPGHKEQKPSDWLEALDYCMTGLRSQGLDMQSVEGIGVSGQQHGLVALDSRDRVVRPAKLWCDTSTSQQCDEILGAAGGAEAYQQEIGNLLPPGFTASKILWMKQQDVEAYARVRFLMLPHDYLNFHLTGERTAEAGDASGTGYFRVRQRCWSEKALVWIDPDRDLRETLAPLIDSHDSAGVVRPALARRWGLSSGVSVSSGGGDNMMGAIGSGNVEVGTVTVSLGTSGTLFSFSDRPVVDPRGEIAAFCDSTGGWLPLGCTMNVTVATEMVRSSFLRTHLDGFEEAVRTVPAGSEGLLLVPYLEGERLPNVPDGTGVLLGLRSATASPAHLARAAMEGVTLGLRYGLDRFKELGIQAREIRLIGGGSRSATWRQIASDIFGVPVVCPRLQEGPAIGAAYQAMWSRGGGSVGDVVSRHFRLDEATRCVPKPQSQSVYDDLYGVYSRLVDSLLKSGVFQLHRRLIGG